MALAKGAGRFGVLHVNSHVASKSIGEVLAARAPGQQIGWQLYMDVDRYVHDGYIETRDLAAQQIRDATSKGAMSIWMTVDTTIVSPES